MKRFLSHRKGVFALLLALFMGMGTAYAYSFSATCSTGQTLYYNIIDPTNHYVEITYPGTVNNWWVGFNKPTGSLNMGTTVTYNGITYTIKGISWYAFYECTGLSGSLTIPNTVTSIGYGAFWNCTGFTGSLTIGSSVTYIGSHAFDGCTGFTGSLTIPNSVTEIGMYAFTWLSGLTGSLTLSNSLTVIHEGAFEYCQNLSGNLSLPNSLTTIGFAAFLGCRGFTGSLTIPNSVTSINEMAFEGCTGFTGTLTIGTGVTSIGNGAFKLCTGFTRVNFNAINCTDVSYDTKPFEGCTATTLVIGSSVQRIPAYMFYLCNKFTGSLTIPNSVTKIGTGAFRGCTGFSGSLTIGNSVTTIGNAAFYGCSGFTGSLTIGNSVTTIGSSAFQSCFRFTGSLTIPHSVTTIGNGAFKLCTGFTRVNFNAINCTDVSYDTKPFEGCTATTLTIGSSVQRIPDYMFLQCSNFTGSLTIPNSVTSIGYAAFSGSGFTGSLTIGNSVTTIGHSAFLGCSGFTGQLSLGNSVTTIGEYAFSNCQGFTGPLTIPNSVTTISTSAFNNCSGFTSSLTIGTGVTSIGPSAFRYCSGLTQVNYNATDCADVASDAKPFEACSGSLTIGNNVQRIPAYMFNGAGFTGHVTIGTDVTSIGASAFKDCTSVTRVNYNATICGDVDYLAQPFENCTGTLIIGSNVTRIPANIFYYADFAGSLSIPGSVTTIGNSAFDNCDGLTGYLSLGTSLTTIGAYAFYFCGLTGSLIIPNSLTTLDTYAFCGCSGFTSLTIGSNVNTMNYGAFYSCTGLTSMTVCPVTPPTLGDDVFKYVSRDIPVYVPCIALEDYQAAATWNEFNLQCNPVVTVTAVPTEGGSVSGGGTFTYGNQCTVSATPNSGYLFMHWTKNGTVASSNATYSFYVYNDTDLEAVFIPQWYAGTVIGEGEETNVFLPSYSYYNYTLSEQIYTADELGGSRTITNISFFNAGSEKTRTYDIYMKHTTKTAFSSNTDWISASTSNKVYSGTVVMRAGQWTTIVLDTPFAYNASSNLVLIVDDNTGSWSSGMSCRVYNANGNQAIRIYDDHTDYDPASPSSYSGTLMSVKNQILFDRPLVFNIAATSSNTNAGTVTGGGTYGAGDICRLKATARSGYTFMNWVNYNGVTVSTDANYTFTVTGSRSLTANFLSDSGEMCSLTFDLYDIYGDGWNGNYLVVDYEDGTSVKLAVTGDYNDTYTLPFVTGSHVDLSWIEGSWPTECYFTVSYEDGNVMYMAMDLDENFEYGFDVDCAGQPEDVTYLGDHGAANNYYLPSYSLYKYALSEQIYTAEEIGMEGFINGIAFYNNGAPETRYYDIYLATTDETAFESKTDWIDASDAVLVYSGEVTMQSDKWTSIKFTESSFDYDGVSNLVLIMDDNTGNYTGSPHMSCLVYETDGLQALRVINDDTNYDPNNPSSYVGTLANVKNQVVFGMVTCYEPTDLYVINVTANSAEVSWSSSHPNEFEVQYGLASLDYDFEDGLSYWTTIDADGDGIGWVPASATSGVYYSYNLSDYFPGQGHNGSDNMAVSGSYSSIYGPLTPDNYLVSPRVTLGGSITFWACAQDASYAAEHFGVAVSTTSNTNASAFTTIQEWTMTAKSTGAKVNPETTRSGNREQGTWYQYTVDLSAYAGQTGYVAIRHFNCTDMFVLNVDDITIVQPGITLTTINNVTNTYVSLTDLTPGSQYEVKVRSHCGGAYYSDWVSTSFTTPSCDAIFVDADNPFFESFEDAGFPPACWENRGTASNQWSRNINLYRVHTGSASAYSGYYGDIYLVMPDIELSADASAAQFSFWSYNTYPSDFATDNNTVVLLNGGSETVLWSAEEVSQSWEKTTIDLSAYLGQTISLAFKYAGSNGNGWYIDDVEVSVPTNVTQTIQLASGVNWVSFYVETTLDDLKTALVSALSNAPGIKITSQSNGYTSWNGSSWRGSLNSIDVSQMYVIEVPAACDITLEAMPIDPAEHPITIVNGTNWIGFPFSANMSLTDAFDGFAVNGDKVSSLNGGSATYQGSWNGGLSTLQPGQGYKLEVTTTGQRTFTFPSSAKKATPFNPMGK